MNSRADEQLSCSGLKCGEKFSAREQNNTRLSSGVSVRQRWARKLGNGGHCGMGGLEHPSEATGENLVTGK